MLTSKLRSAGAIPDRPYLRPRNVAYGDDIETEKKLFVEIWESMRIATVEIEKDLSAPYFGRSRRPSKNKMVQLEDLEMEKMVSELTETLSNAYFQLLENRMQRIKPEYMAELKFFVKKTSVDMHNKVEEIVQESFLEPLRTFNTAFIRAYITTNKDVKGGKNVVSSSLFFSPSTMIYLIVFFRPQFLKWMK